MRPEVPRRGGCKEKKSYARRERLSRKGRTECLKHRTDVPAVCALRKTRACIFCRGKKKGGLIEARKKKKDARRTRAGKNKPRRRCLLEKGEKKRTFSCGPALPREKKGRGPPIGARQGRDVRQINAPRS